MMKSTIRLDIRLSFLSAVCARTSRDRPRDGNSSSRARDVV
jgi:hypothetical protein